MTKWILLALTLALAWYVWKDDDFGNSFTEQAVIAQPSTKNEWCEVKNIDCRDLTRMLNSFRPGRYFEATGKLFGTSVDNMTALRGNNEVTFLVSDHVKVVHTQSGKEKGYVTVIFADGRTMKYDKKGKLVSVSK